MNLHKEWLRLKKLEKETREARVEVERKLWQYHHGFINGNTAKSEDYKISITRPETWKVDNEATYILESVPCFKIKYEVDKKAFKALGHEQQELARKAFEIKPGKPTFKIEVIDEN